MVTVQNNDTTAINTALLSLQKQLQNVNTATKTIEKETILKTVSNSSSNSDYDVSISNLKKGQSELTKGQDELTDSVSNLQTLVSELEASVNKATSVINQLFPYNSNTYIPSMDQIREETIETAVSEASTMSIRVLESLNEPGTEGEVAVYKNNIYIYTDGFWEKANSDAYKGVFDDVAPELIDGDYFLVGEDFYEASRLVIDSKFLIINNKYLEVNYTFEKAFIYLCENGAWVKLTDKNDWRYIIAQNDLIAMGEITPNLELAIKGNSGMLYLGPLEEKPYVTVDGQYFVYSGETTSQFEKGYVYRIKKGVWSKLDTEDSANATLYMFALKDVLEVQKDVSGGNYFSTLFANALMASTAVIQKLSTQIITLQQNGKIRSQNYVDSQGTEGFEIDGDTGDIIANNGYFRGVLGGKIDLPNTKTDDKYYIYIPYNIFDYKPTNIKLMAEIYYNNWTVRKLAVECLGDGFFTPVKIKYGDDIYFTTRLNGLFENKVSIIDDEDNKRYIIQFNITSGYKQQIESVNVYILYQIIGDKICSDFTTE